jgi:hypothetical protein
VRHHDVYGLGRALIFDKKRLPTDFYIPNPRLPGNFSTLNAAVASKLNYIPSMAPPHIAKLTQPQLAPIFTSRALYLDIDKVISYTAHRATQRGLYAGLKKHEKAVSEAALCDTVSPHPKSAT